MYARFGSGADIQKMAHHVPDGPVAFSLSRRARDLLLGLGGLSIWQGRKCRPGAVARGEKYDPAGVRASESPPYADPKHRTGIGIVSVQAERARTMKHPDDTVPLALVDIFEGKLNRDIFEEALAVALIANGIVGVGRPCIEGKA